MQIKNHTRYTITVHHGHSLRYTVNEPNGNTNFVSPATKPGSKIYLISLDGRLHYVGFTKQGMASRINAGLKAEGAHGYHGYKWKDLKRPLTLDVFCLDGNRVSDGYLEAIEAEIAFLCRAKTEQWPLSQTEIHFQQSRVTHRELAKEIFERVKVG